MLNKKILLVIVLFIVSIAGTTFAQFNTLKLKDTQKTLNGYYFTYIGPPNPWNFSEYTDPDNYVLLSEYPSDVCEVGNEALCAIFASYYWDGYEYKPDFSDRSWGNIYDQLYSYWGSGLQGMSIYLKDL